LFHQAPVPPSLQPSEEIQALMKAPLSKRLVRLLFLKETSVLLLRILTD
jgi:hypothetical protein